MRDSTGSWYSSHVTRTCVIIANAVHFSTCAWLPPADGSGVTSTEARGPHLEVVVLVDGAASVRWHVSHGGQVCVLTGEQEEVHAAALRHTLLGQLLIHSFLRLEQSLEQRRNKTSPLNAWAGWARPCAAMRRSDLLFLRVDQLLVVPVLQFARSLSRGHGRVEDEEFSAAFCSLGGRQRRAGWGVYFLDPGGGSNPSSNNQTQACCTIMRGNGNKTNEKYEHAQAKANKQMPGPLLLYNRATASN